MTVFVSLLRAINVAGHATIRMAALADVYADLGFDDVTTVLQSGNVIFTARGNRPSRIAATIGMGIESAFGIRPDVMLRTADELHAVIAGNPCAGRPDVAPNHLMVMFLDRKPTKSAIAALDAANKGPEEVWPRDRELFVHYPDGMGRSKLSGAVIERALGVRGTARNWNTVSKVVAVMDRIEAG